MVLFGTCHISFKIFFLTADKYHCAFYLSVGRKTVYKKEGWGVCCGHTRILLLNSHFIQVVIEFFLLIFLTSQHCRLVLQFSFSLVLAFLDNLVC